MRYSSAQVYKMTDDAYVCACARASALNQRMLISEASEHEPVMFFKKKKTPLGGGAALKRAAIRIIRWCLIEI